LRDIAAICCCLQGRIQAETAGVMVKSRCILGVLVALLGAACAKKVKDQAGVERILGNALVVSFEDVLKDLVENCFATMITGYLG